MGDDDPSIMKPLVFLVTFVAVFALIFSYMSSAVIDPSSSTQVSDWTRANFGPEDIAETTFWLNDDSDIDINRTDGYPVETSDWNTYWTPGGLFGSEPVHDDGAEFEFYSDTGSPPDQTVHVYPIGEMVGSDYDSWSYSIMFYQSWGWWDKEWQYITFDEIVDSAVTKARNIQSKVHIDLKGGMDVFILFPLNTDPAAVLDSGEDFTIVLGQSVLDSVESTGNIWNAMSGLLTMNLHTGSEIVDIIISIPILAMIAYITYVVVTRLIPFL